MSDHKPPARPQRQLCPVCALDDDVELDLIDNEWVFACDSRAHPPIEWRPKEQFTSSAAGRSGVAEELGVYDDLLACVTGGMVEWGVIEHRYATENPVTYRQLVDQYGHTVFGPKRFTVSAFLARALGQLWREGMVVGRIDKATGYWAYNSTVSYWGQIGVADEGDAGLTWAEFAERDLHVDANDWPALGYTAESRD